MSKLLTLLPPTFAVDERMGTANGVNNAFRAKYWRFHPRAAAIAAHEVRESRMTSLTILVFLGIGALVGFGFSHLAMEAPPWQFATAGASLGLTASVVLQMMDGTRRNTNLTGEATEIVVEAQHYGQDLEVMLREGAHQLCTSSSYADFFDQGDAEAIYRRLKEKIPSARRWVERNHRLIEKAISLQNPN